MAGFLPHEEFRHTRGCRNRIGPHSAVAEGGHVVVVEYVEHRRTQTYRAQHHHAGGLHLLGLITREEVLVGDMHQPFDAGVSGGHGGLPAHRMHLHHHAHLAGFVVDRAQHCHFLLVGPRKRGQRDLAGELDTKGGQPAHFGAGFVGTLVQRHPAGRNDAWAVDQPLIDMVTQRDVAVSRAAARQYRGVSGFQQRLHLRFFFGPGIDVAMGVDEARHRRASAGIH